MKDSVEASREAMAEEPDFYEEDGFVVFTAAHHLRRGSCCGSGCRHCPWRADEVPTPASSAA